MCRNSYPGCDPSLRGIFALLFEVAAMAYPGKTILLPVQITGAFRLMNGVFILMAANFRSYVRDPMVGPIAARFAGYYYRSTVFCESTDERRDGAWVEGCA
ncbi:MAG: hypothetical protein GY801_15785 [bacterium]|nr:hypothetical protein [bacterium]